MIDKGKRNEIRSRWDACHPANGEDDVMSLLDALDEQEAEIARLRKGLEQIARSSVPGTKTEYGKGVAVGAGVAIATLESCS